MLNLVRGRERHDRDTAAGGTEAKRLAIETEQRYERHRRDLEQPDLDDGGETVTFERGNRVGELVRT